ncbi:transmembrane protein 180-like isoform X2 [Corticium candelabrum]|uniref:transmembrane protein 180-like isoform X2 n=1 Tax=Corticium candelabrum TaxID=121492 RepID=UPI002E261A4D|nr:transmembrane protein 180-like isoform X2 [Corticium candelabrum]
MLSMIRSSDGCNFLLPWFSWGEDDSLPWIAGVHLIISLWLYDAMFTYVLLAQCALFAEISLDSEERHVVLRYSQVASIIGSTSVFWCELLSHNLDDITRFQVCCVCIALLSWISMTYSGSTVRVASEVALSEGDIKKRGQQLSMMTLILQLVRNKNFMCFITVNFLQIFHNTFGANFFSMFSNYFLSADEVGSMTKTLLAGSAFAIPQLFVLIASPWLSTLGSYYLILYSFYLKLFLASFMYIMGSSHVFLLVLFFFLDRTVPEAVFSLFVLPLSDIIDADRITHKRSSPISSTVFGTNALFTKPAQSLAPMIVVRILSSYGYRNQGLTLGDQAVNLSANTGSASELGNVMFLILCGIPLVVSLLQIMVWSQYTLRKSTNTQGLHLEVGAENLILDD